MSNTGDKIMSGLVDFGKIKAQMGFYISIVVAIICFGIARYYYINSNRDLITSIAKVTEDSNPCTEIKDKKGNITTTCTTRISYNVNNISYSVTLQTNMKYIKGDSIEISYDNKKPEIATLKPFSTDTLVGILIAVGVIAIIVSGLNYYFTQKSDVFAGVEGVTAGASVAKGVFNFNYND